jgi:Uma2 family endonuclease
MGRIVSNLDVVPELVFEVRSPTERWPRQITKAGEHLEAAVTVVCLLDQGSETVQVYRADELPQTLHADDELHLPDTLGDLRVAVSRFFERAARNAFLLRQARLR